MEPSVIVVLDSLRINLISELDENSLLKQVVRPNQVYAWFLRKAFVENDVDARFICGSNIPKTNLPKTDHTIVISSAASPMIKNMEYIQKLRSSTAGKLTLYMNIDKLRGGNDQHFDYCFTQIGPTIYRPEKYVCVGWGVDQNYSYPEQSEKAVFLGSKASHPQMLKKVRKAYQIYDSVLSKLNIKTYNPVIAYGKSRRLSYPDYQAILRKCHYFLCTHYGEGGLNRLEAAACGALLVVPRVIFRKRTMSLLNHQVWRTEEELTNILHEDVDIEANRQRALEHRWEDVVKRIMGVLDS